MQTTSEIYVALSDEDLAIRIGTGDNAAFKEIYDRYNSLLLIYAQRKLQDKEEAKDIVQEVFITIWANHRNFLVSTTLSGYLYRSVLNRILNNFRRKGFCARYVEHMQYLINDRSTPADYLIREKEFSALMEKEIAALPAGMREVFEMRTKLYLSNKDVAERLEISEHTVATHMKKALRILRLKFGAHAALLYILMR